MILVPVKNSKYAKQRLAALLDESSRTALAQAMLLDVLETLYSWRRSADSIDSGIALVTCDSFATGLASDFEFEVIRDESNLGETGAIEQATLECQERGETTTLVVPADVPLIAEWELNEIFDAAPQEGCVLVPASDGRGTNAALRRPAALFPLRFGNDSFKPHVRAAETSERPCVILSLPGIGLDVDQPEDLQQLVLAPGYGHAQQLARRWNLSFYPLAANE